MEERSDTRSSASPDEERGNKSGEVVIVECFNDWGGRGYDDSVAGDGTKITPSGDRTT